MLMEAFKKSPQGRDENDRRWSHRPAATAVLGILSIAFIAIIYEGSGQTDLAMITSTLSYLTILVLGMSLMATVMIMKIQH